MLPLLCLLCSLGNEFGAVHKPWESADIRFALTYPEIYEGGRSLLLAQRWNGRARACRCCLHACSLHRRAGNARCCFSAAHSPSKACPHSIAVRLQWASAAWATSPFTWPPAEPQLRPCAISCAVGASNLGHIILYALLNKQEGLLCDRAYYPGEDLQVRTIVP